MRFYSCLMEHSLYRLYFEVHGGGLRNSAEAINFQFPNHENTVPI